MLEVGQCHYFESPDQGMSRAQPDLLKDDEKSNRSIAKSKQKAARDVGDIDFHMRNTPPRKKQIEGASTLIELHCA